MFDDWNFFIFVISVGVIKRVLKCRKCIKENIVIIQFIFLFFESIDYDYVNSGVNNSFVFKQIYYIFYNLYFFYFCNFVKNVLIIIVYICYMYIK